MTAMWRLASWLALAAVWAHHLGGAAGVRIRDLDVPAVALQDDDVHLRCDYEDEGGSALYTLKWYKDGREFYRHQPGISRHAADDRCLDHHTYHVDGVNVDCWVSTEREVVLRAVSRTTSGDYQCEVIGEHPKFRKEVLKARLTVFSEALQRPVVSGARQTYHPLDIVDLNCSSANTQYLPLLSWHLNGRPAPSTYLVKGSDRRTLGLRFQARADLFHRGVIRAACVTSLGSHHSRSPEVILRDPDYLSAQEYYYNTGGGGWSAGRVLPCLLLLLLLLASTY
ncbi:uncharacterized protein [Panulirus ornatus]|uniref:uncharacterized protein n=1 Tax=Panulirus ornatus TaxID=150431 RepID=UPI003A895BDF